MDVLANGTTEVWKQWQGEVIDGKFRLLEYLGGTDHSAVFITDLGERGPGRVAIKLVAEDPDTAEDRLSRWKLVAKLSHPHLIRMFQTGRARVANTTLLYVVMEYAQENLSQILPDRPLTPTECHDMLTSLVDVLADIHAKDIVHGHVKPSNIMAVDDQLKLSSDGFSRAGKSRGGLDKPGLYDAPEIPNTGISPADDVWSLGMTLVECLTKRLPVWQNGKPIIPEELPQPFLDIARNCLHPDPQRRWTVAEIKARLQPSSTVTGAKATVAPAKTSPKWRYIVPAGVVLVLLAIQATRLPKRRPEIPRAASRAPEALPMKAATPGVIHGAVVSQSIPKVPETARETIQGTVRVTVRVAVDASGNVTRATLDSPGPSKYFADLALQGARRWKFSATNIDGRDVASEWILRFQFERTVTKVFPVQTAP